jgi:hypothetical protein
MVNLTGSHPHLENVRFWDGCKEGCVLNLAGAGARLSPKTRKEICLNRISVFFDGDIPFPIYEDDIVFTKTLGNQNGDIFNLSDPNFVDSIDLRSKGRAYTGVSFSKVQAGNLCGNPEAKRVVAILYSVFGTSVLVVGFASWALARRMSISPSVGKGGAKETGVAVVSYFFGSVGAVLFWWDFYTDIRVLLEVWGAWPQWVLLACIVAPYVVSTSSVMRSWASGVLRCPWSSTLRLRLRWIWPPPQMASAATLPLRAIGFLGWVALLIVWPLCVPVVLFLDVIAFIDMLGFHPVIGPHVYSLDLWYDSRSLVELLVRTIPQGAFQTTVYLLGSSRATNVYIDQTLFVQSIATSLLTILFQLVRTIWQAREASEYPWVTFWNRLQCSRRSWVVEIPSKEVSEVEISEVSKFEKLSLTVRSS